MARGEPFYVSRRAPTYEKFWIRHSIHASFINMERIKEGEFMLILSPRIKHPTGKSQCALGPIGPISF